MAEVPVKKALQILSGGFEPVFCQNLPRNPRICSARDFNLSQRFFQAEFLSEAEAQSGFTGSAAGKNRAVNVKEKEGWFCHREGVEGAGSLPEDLPDWVLERETDTTVPWAFTCSTRVILPLVS